MNPTKFRRLPGDHNQLPNSQSSVNGGFQLVPSVSPKGDQALASATLDPFSSMTVPLTQRTNSHFQHCKWEKYESYDSHIPLVILALNSIARHLVMLHTVKCCWPFQPEMLGVWCGDQAMTQPAIFYGMIAMSASHRFHLDLIHKANSLEAPQWMVQALDFRARVIRSIQEMVNRMATSEIELAAVMIALLICVEVRLGFLILNIIDEYMTMTNLIMCSCSRLQTLITRKWIFIWPVCSE
jgi:hypothetical protein